jgi:hypothetical protein
MLDDYESRGVDDLRELARALVVPSAAKLSDTGGGRQYLRIHAEVINYPEPDFTAPEPDPAVDSVARWRLLVGPMLTDVAVRRLHHRFTAMRVSATELARRAAARPHRDDQLFTSHLVDLVTALLAAPVSAETATLLSARTTRAR